jgi:formate-dependent nitrite reductase membrane component NrfD
MTDTITLNSPERSGQTIWGWKIAAYLFLAGVGAGAYAVGAAADLLGAGWEEVSLAGVAVGPLLVLASTAFLITDLGVPRGFLRAGARPGSSWISRGVFILTAFIIIGFINLFLQLWPYQVLAEAETARLTLEVAGLVFAVLTMVYTGLLLGAVRPIPFWNNAVLPVLFLLSALSTGVMTVFLMLSISSLGMADGAMYSQLSGLSRADALILGLEAVVVLFYIIGCYYAPSSRSSAEMLLTGSLAPVFWIGLVAAGLALPFTFDVMHTTLHQTTGAGKAAAIALAASIPGLLGGLFLRYIVVAGGMRVPLKAVGMMVSTSAKARF